jgi:hypothetical protein
MEFQFPVVDIAFNTFIDNHVSITIALQLSQHFPISGCSCQCCQNNAVSQVINFYGFTNSFFKAALLGNIFQDNTVYESTPGSNAVLVLVIRDAVFSPHLLQIHRNQFNNPSSCYEISTAEMSPDNPSSYKIISTDNHFSISDKNNISASLIDDRLQVV